MSHQGETARYYRDRQRVRGWTWRVSEDPDLAAEQLSGYLGGVRRAQAWATELADALKRRAA